MERYERLVHERPESFRYELANEAGEPFGMPGSSVVGWARELGVKLPPAPKTPFRGPFAGGGAGLSPVCRQAAERYLSLVEAYPQASRKQHAYAAADEFGLARESVEDAARRLLAERNRAGGDAPETVCSEGMLTGAGG